MFKQVEYSEILFNKSLLNFGRCAHDGSSIEIMSLRTTEG